MELNEYQENAMATCLPSSKNFEYMFYGLVGEVGELASKVAKAIRKNQLEVTSNNMVPLMSAEKESEFVESLKGEIGDVLWFVAGLSRILGMSLDEVGEYNIAKLKSRQQRGVIEGNGDNR